MTDQSANNSTAQKVHLSAALLLKQIQEKEIDPKTLTHHERRLCVRLMMHNHEITLQEMAMVMCVDRSTIVRDKQSIRAGDEIGQLIMDEAQIAMDLIEAAEYAATRLDKQKKHKDAWTVRKECLEKLQDLGYVKKVAKELNVKGQFSLLEVLELGKQADEFSAEDGSGEDFAARNGGALANS